MYSENNRILFYIFKILVISILMILIAYDLNLFMKEEPMEFTENNVNNSISSMVTAVNNKDIIGLKKITNSNYVTIKLLKEFWNQKIEIRDISMTSQTESNIDLRLELESANKIIEYETQISKNRRGWRFYTFETLNE